MAALIVVLAAITTVALLSVKYSGPVDASAQVLRIAHVHGRSRYCKRHGRARGCIKVPKSARRPHGAPEQTPVSKKGAVDTGGLGSGPGVREAAAIDWAKSQERNTAFAFYCESFVEAAYGTNGQFRTAWAAATAIGLTHRSIMSAPAGALVFFAPNSINPYGHVGLSLGNGLMISALSSVQITNIPASPYWSSLYRGWATAPASWPGRIPAPPGGSNQPLSNSAIQITSPALGSTVSGTIDLTADAANVAGVAFYAYYASDPTRQSTVGWHLLGDGTDTAQGWTLGFNTTTIPDQGNPAWGIVNISAVALNGGGVQTGTRDYRRIAIDNAGGIVPTTPTTTTTTPSTTTTPTTTTVPTTTYAETTGSVAHTWTNYQDAGGTEGPSLAAQETVQVACKTAGFEVSDGDTWWYLVASSPWNSAYYVSADAFYNDGATSGSLQGTPFEDPNVPNC